jgi:hypothetical protein
MGPKKRGSKRYVALLLTLTVLFLTYTQLFVEGPTIANSQQHTPNYRGVTVPVGAFTSGQYINAMPREVSKTCIASVLDYSKKNSRGFFVLNSNGLKKMTARLGEVKNAALSLLVATTNFDPVLAQSYIFPYLVDVGAGIYGNEWSTVSTHLFFLF